VIAKKQKSRRKIVILGDTCNASSLHDLAQNADVVVHETTYPNHKTAEAIRRFHSTPGLLVYMTFSYTL
jgi:ribonuclease BN (tRNA processing enzyme)